MDFKNASELLALCTQQQLPISEIMRRRECQLGETTRDEVTHRMKRALEIMRSSALTPLKTPVKSMGGLIGGGILIWQLAVAAWYIPLTIYRLLNVGRVGVAEIGEE